MSDNEIGKRRFRVTRRGVLLGIGATGVGLAVGVVVGRKQIYGKIGGLLAGGMGTGGGETNPAVWFEVLPSNVVRLIMPKVEMGQGAHTALKQIAADELCASWDQVEVVQGSTSHGPADGQGTVGSTSVSGLYMPLRTAAATLREMLLVRAAQMLNVDQATLVVKDGVVKAHSGDGKNLNFGEIVAGVKEWPELKHEAQLKSADQFEFIGKPMQRVDFDAKLRGVAHYGYDLRVDGMLYGAVARPPKLGAKMIAAKPGAAANQPGVVKVVIDVEHQFAGVVANTRQQARNAVEKIDIQWQSDRTWQQADIDAMLDVSDDIGVPIQNDGDVARVLSGGQTLSAEYAVPLGIHAQLEPQAALADVRADQATVHMSTQSPASARSLVAAAIGMKEKQVTVTPAYVGGGFGRKIGVECGVEAARLSHAVGKPVHLGWTRQEDMRNGYYRPPMKSRFTARIDKGRIAAIRNNHASGEVLFPIFPSAVKYALGADPGAWRGAYGFYNRIENRKLSTYTASLPVPTGAWRGLGLFPNTFACESFMDEMAHAAGTDPCQFRLDHLADDAVGKRMRAVLDAVTKRADYGREMPAGHAQGIACCIDVGTVVAMVVEISIADDGTIVVHRAVQAVEAGRVVNPNGALAQAQGSIVMSLSATLLEGAVIEDGNVAPKNFDRYPLLTLDRVPEIDVMFLDSDAAPNGMGEPCVGPVPAAIGNAVFNLTGARLRRIPFTPENVLAAKRAVRT